MYLFQVMNMTMRTVWSSEVGTADPWPSGCSEVRHNTAAQYCSVLHNTAQFLVLICCCALRLVSQPLLTLHRVTLHDAL